ncbi:hypothetical protein PCANC_25661 [Puccinia coronata f. sp. avenae]|uniref:Uncharacterized protein n=1 Tax=Puccinia coronata f. sp. avenae TaxID=200324 RepID=A0A2N5SC92_9BASI|nr:hypothetical protein PCANC_25661 [Puccinia coronata f. sp. avenae]
MTSPSLRGGCSFVKFGDKGQAAGSSSSGKSPLKTPFKAAADHLVASTLTWKGKAPEKDDAPLHKEQSSLDQDDSDKSQGFQPAPVKKACGRPRRNQPNAKRNKQA